MTKAVRPVVYTDNIRKQNNLSQNIGVSPPQSIMTQKEMESVLRRMNGNQFENTLKLIVHWEQSLQELKRKLEGISDWGPFELVSVSPISFEKGNKVRALCRFIYHGSKAAREHNEWNLKILLQDIAVWEETPSPERMA